METPENRSLRSNSFGDNTSRKGDEEDNDKDEYGNNIAVTNMLSMMNEESAMNVTQRQKRRGARCPVHGVNLIASGDQLYAPYLQRNTPLTDDVLLQRRVMLASPA
eukprot:12153401-Ditylum_brightwellii.AAC.1